MGYNRDFPRHFNPAAAGSGAEVARKRSGIWKPDDDKGLAYAEMLERKSAEEFRARKEGREPDPSAWGDYSAKPNGSITEDTPLPLKGICAATLKGMHKPREFIDAAEIFPARNVSLVQGEGDIGKSRLALQLALACTTQTQWLGVDVMQGAVVYFSAEDDEDEMGNRLNEICDADGIDLGLAKDLTIIDMVGEDTVLAEAKLNGAIKPQLVYQRVRATLATLHPVLLILDNLADIFAGNENNRVHAKQFVTLIRNLCLTFNCHVLMLGHPSLTGRGSGTGESGSTAWNNSVRTRLYLRKPDGVDAHDESMILEVMKANYRREPLRWEVIMKDGRFVRTEAKNAFSRITTNDMEQVRERFGSERHRVNEQSTEWGGYAVAEILDWDVGKGVGKSERSVEQNKNRANIRTYLGTWLRNKVIHVVPGLGPDRKPTQFYSDRAAN